MTRLILNDKEISTLLHPGTTLLDFIRYHRSLRGTKVGCREGDCGACTVLVGELTDSGLQYRSVTSCLMPLGNAAGKHIVTIEGVNMEGLNPIQQAICEENGTQCGFCTPGFVMSLAGYCLSGQTPAQPSAIAAIDGNICRCTGYKSIERAAARVVDLLRKRGDEDPAGFAAAHQLLPVYFAGIKQKLLALQGLPNGEEDKSTSEKLVAGGTDLYVQQHDRMPQLKLGLLADQPGLKGIFEKDGSCYIGGGVTVSEMGTAEVLQRCFPALDGYLKLVSSTPIRNMATIGGNFVNASPIGDLTIFFLALDAQLVLAGDEGRRTIALKDFYKGYKQLDKEPGELVEQAWFTLPGPDTRFNFEKVSKRTHLDIASVNSALRLEMRDGVIAATSLSAGGVGPTPMLLANASAFLCGKIPDEDLVHDVTRIALSEISPISDARGSAAYKSLLLSQLIKAHFIKLFPSLRVEKILLTHG